MVQNVLELHTDAALLSKLSRAAGKNPTTQELLEQRVSFVFGSISSKSGVTREKVREMLIAEGAGAVQAK